MATETIIFRIPKKKAEAIRPSKTGFRLPEANRYFARVMHDKGVLANSQCINEEEPEEARIAEEGSSEPVVTRSASLQLSRKLSIARAEQKLFPQMHSLPKI